MCRVHGRWHAFCCSHMGEVMCIDGLTGRRVWAAVLPDHTDSGLTLTADLKVQYAPSGVSMHALHSTFVLKQHMLVLQLVSAYSVVMGEPWMRLSCRCMGVALMSPMNMA